MSNIESDERGLLLACPNCGKRNRLKYEGLGQTFRCAQCKNELQSPREPIDIKSDLVFDALTGTLRFTGPGGFLGAMVRPVQDGCA